MDVGEKYFRYVRCTDPQRVDNPVCSARSFTWVRAVREFRLACSAPESVMRIRAIGSRLNERICR